jgi:putative addiction module antidote
MGSITKIIAIGDSLGIIIPEEMLARLKVGVGDTLYLTEIAQGIRLTPFDPESVEQMDAAREIMRENHGVLKRLSE